MFVMVGAIVFLVAADDSSPPRTQTASVSDHMSSDLPIDPDVIITLRPPLIEEFTRGLQVLPHRSISLDYERNQALLTWAPETGEELRAATITVLEDYYAVERVQRVR